MKRVRSFLRALIGRGRFEDTLNDELRLHVELQAADFERAGLSRDEALRRARLALGGLEMVKDECRQARGLRIADAVARDVRHAVRVMRRSPAFTFTALATLTLCLGANLTIFAAVDGILLRPLPFPDAGRLTSVYNTYPAAGVLNDGCSLTNYYERRGRIRAFASLSAYRQGTSIVGDPGATERVQTMRVTPEFFDTLGVRPGIGRTFTEGETSLATPNAAIVTDGFWRRRLQADPNVLSRTIRVNGTTVPIAGVLPASFHFLSATPQIFLPLKSDPGERTVKDRHSGNARMIARLAPGASIEAAQAEIDAQNAALEATNPAGPAMAQAGFRSIVVSLHGDHVASVRPILLIVQGAALCLLLVGGVNLVNLLFIRATARRRERAVRQAIGASRGQIVREVLIETMILTVAGGACGLALGAAGVRLIALLGVDQLPLGARIGVDGRMGVVAMVGSVPLGLVMSVPVAWFSLRDWSTNPVRTESRSITAGRAAERLRRVFVVAEIALAFVLLAGAGVLAVSLKRALGVAPGFRADHVMTGTVRVAGRFASQDAVLAFVDRLRATLGDQPGIQASGLATNVPLSGIDNKSAVTVQGYVRPPGQSLHGHYSYSVDGDFVRALGLDVVEGRALTAADSRRPERVCIVDEDFARFYFPGSSAIGHRVWSGSQPGPDAEAYTIVGVVSPMKQAALTESAGQGAAFFPYGHRMDGEFYLVVRGTQTPADLAETMRRAVRETDADVAVGDVRSMDDRVADSLVARRSPALLAGAFAIVALLLTSIGTYGVLSFAVAQRRREIGLRLALGAQPSQVRAGVVGAALRLVAAGLGIGVASTWLAGRFIQTVLFDVPAFDPRTLTVSALALVVVAILASVLPSGRAAAISPLEAMSAE